MSDSERKLERALAKVAVLEEMLEDKTRDLFLANRDLRVANDYMSAVLEAMPNAMLLTGADGTVQLTNSAACRLLDCPAAVIIDRPLVEIAPGLSAPRDGNEDVEVEWIGKDGCEIPVLVTASEVGDRGEWIYVGIDLRNRKRREVELRHHQKLQAVGELAAGIAHEINNPVQFISDALYFLKDSYQDAQNAIRKSTKLIHAAEKGMPPATTIEEAREACDDADFEFLEERVPKAFECVTEGLERIAKIVAAMKEFSHPGQVEMAPSDLNRAVENALMVSSAEHKYVADIELELGEIPEVNCFIGDINQVLLNLIVNAAHAIGDHRQEGERGQIGIRTFAEGEEVVIEIADDGPGIPQDIQERVFEPFFTTKDVGKGTGQGLAIARSIVIRHQGKLDFESTPGEGTMFSIRLPREGA